MNILSTIGGFLFIISAMFAVYLSFFEPKWYWERFIPKWYKLWDKHPFLTRIPFAIISLLMLYGIFTNAMKAIAWF